MVSYMWGKDVADALDASDDAPKLDEAWARGADIYKSIDRGINRLYELAVGLLPDSNDKDDFEVSAADIERALQDRRDRMRYSAYRVYGTTTGADPMAIDLTIRKLLAN